LKHILYFLFLLLFSSCIQWAHDPFSSPPTNPDEDTQSDSIRIKIANYNAGFGINSTPDKVAEVLFPFNFDIICFNEIPSGNWIERVGKILDMKYSFVGKVSSANKKDNYKGILCKVPIQSSNEYILNSKGWQPASVITVVIENNSNLFGIYCLQIAGSNGEKGSYANVIATNLMRRLKDARIILSGDFENSPDDKALKLFYEGGMNNIWKNLNINTSNESSVYTDINNSIGITDQILYSKLAHSHTVKGGFIETKPTLSDHKIVWALLEFPPPLVKKKRV
jgi:maltose 6'-phosphate phosphatase